MSGESNDKMKREQRKRKFVRIKASTSIYIFKGVAFMGLATIAIITSQTVNALLLGALTYAVGIIFDMWILSTDNSAPVILWISVFQWIITFVILGLTVLIFVLLVSYDGMCASNIIPKESLSQQIKAWVPVFMYGIGIISASIEAYYSIPYDD